MGPSEPPFGALWGALGAPPGASEAVWGRGGGSWALLDALWGYLGAIWKPPNLMGTQKNEEANMI